MSFKAYREAWWTVKEERILTDKGWVTVKLSAKDMEFLAACNIKWD